MEEEIGEEEAAAAAQRAQEMVGEAAAHEAAELAAAGAAAAGAGADGGEVQGLQQPPGLQRPPVEEESRESQRQRAQEAAARELARAAAARAAAAAAAAVADESEVKRLSLLPRAVVAFRKPVAPRGGSTWTLELIRLFAHVVTRQPSKETPHWCRCLPVITSRYHAGRNPASPNALRLTVCVATRPF